MNKPMQITQATITPTCRANKGDFDAIDEALNEIREKLQFTMQSSFNHGATFQIVANVNHPQEGSKK